jgi:ribonuclease VapC
VIVVDTSALIEIALGGPQAAACRRVLGEEPHLVMSGGTLAEALIVAERRGVRTRVAAMIDGLAPEIVPVTAEEAMRVASAYASWGKGIHPARLNFGDCFAYALARRLACPLLFVGEDFGRTDVAPCLA